MWYQESGLADAKQVSYLLYCDFHPSIQYQHEFDFIMFKIAYVFAFSFYKQISLHYINHNREMSDSYSFIIFMRL